MKTIFFSLIGFFFLITIMPVYAQNNSFDDQLVSSEEYTKLVTSDYILEQKITELQKTNSELNSKIENLTSQITELKKDGIKFGIDEAKLGKAISNNQKLDNGWSQGDILIASSTIFAFFTFGPLVIERFEAKKRSKSLRINQLMLYLIVLGQILQLYVILSIVAEVFSVLIYGFIMSFTLVILASIGMLMRDLLVLSNEPNTQINNLERSIEIADIGFDYDKIREMKKRTREAGE